METLLALAEGLPRRQLSEGDTLLAEGTRPGRLFVLLEGVLRIEKGGVPITSITERGACVGEVSLLLDVPATADVVASEPTTVAVVDDAERVLASDPGTSLALARLLATRVQHMTTYLADLQR
jgi:CRP-like cAMP-binding protein